MQLRPSRSSSGTQPAPGYSRHLLVTNPENVMLIQPPMRIIGRTLVTFPFIISVSMVGSANDRWDVKQQHISIKRGHCMLLI